MKLLKFISCSCFQFLSLIFFIIFLLGALNVHFSDKNDYCVMTYMFEYPQFVRINVPENSVYPQYGLYAYSEGRLTENARKMWFDGVPVLYLPGNLGSYKQSRSLASVALRKALSNVHEYHFDYFTIDYNEELSGLYGGVLESQTEFATNCILRILNLYKNNKYVKTVPESVILIGHSMGGVIAKKLLVHSKTINATSIAISLAAPLEAPVLNFDTSLNEYYMSLNREWNNKSEEIKSKLLLSFGNGARDVLVPSCLTSSVHSDLDSLTTSIPGVWVSPDHVSIVWCKQLVLTINKFLFSTIDLQTKQINQNKQFLMSRAIQYFQANRSMELSPSINRPNVTLIHDGFWYEDNRRIYQISRPDITKTTYLMIRLTSYPQNRFVAIESVNVDDKEWLYGCNAKFVHSTHRYCKTGMSLNELSRWTGAANTFGKRKLATIHLHKLMDMHPDWSHVVVKVSPTRKPILLNVDINDHASREITVDLPYMLTFGKKMILEETERNSLYYELIVPGLNLIHHTYYLYVEPTPTCKAKQLHASAEMHVPWAKNHEYYHYFTHLKKSPMKLRVFRNNPNVTYNLENNENVKVTLLLDPQCTYSISIAPSLYHQIAQLVRNYYSLVIPYTVAVILLATRSNFISLYKNGVCISMHGCLISEELKPYYVLVFTRLAITVLLSTPLLAFIFETANFKNAELQYFLRSLLGVPVYMTALGLVNVIVAIVLVIMICSSQLAHRLLFRIVWRGSSNLAEKMARGLQKAPAAVSAALACAVPLSCGAAALAAGAAFYSFMLSKMYEEYLEDYVYKLMAKLGSKLCYFLKSKKPNDANSLVPIQEKTSEEVNTEENLRIKVSETESNDNKKSESDVTIVASNVTIMESDREKKESDEHSEDKQALLPVTEDMTNDKKYKSTKTNKDIDADLSGLNFHMMLFFLWITVALVNGPALITWARNFKYNMILKPDTSYYPGLILSVCAGFIWQMEAPRGNLKYYKAMTQCLFILAVLVLVLAPLGLYYINYIVTLAFVLITIQQMFDHEEQSEDTTEVGSNETESPDSHNNDDKSKAEDNIDSNDSAQSSTESSEDNNSNCECNENKIYNNIKRFRDKLDSPEELLS